MDTLRLSKGDSAMKKICLALIPFLLFSFSFLSEWSAIDWLELKSVDWRFNLRGQQVSQGNIVVVAIDEKSLGREGRWPWARSRMASLVDRITEGNPAVVGMDIIFAEKSDEDDVLAASLEKSGKVVLGYYFYNNQEEIEKAALTPFVMEQSFQAIADIALPQHAGFQTSLHTMSGVVSNLPSIASHAASQGFFNTLPDRDGMIRHTPLIVRYRDENFASLSLKLFSKYQEDFDPIAIRDAKGVLEGISLKDYFIPTNELGELWVNYRGEGAYNIYSATDVLNKKVPPSVFNNKIVLIGATAVGIYDLRVTPFSPVTPGVFVQADTVETLLTQNFLHLNITTKILSLMALAVIALLTYFFSTRSSLMTGMLLSVLLLVGYASLVYFSFLKGYILAFVHPIMEGGVILFGITAYRSLTEEKEKKKIRKIFQSYLHPDVIEEIVKDPSRLKLGGEKAFCSVLFCDVRNFTAISEKLSPDVLVAMMNDYFDPVTRDIIELGGYIDKLIGDAIMVVFGVPRSIEDHALIACQAALAIQKRAAQLEPVFREKYGVESFKVGVGIHTGDAIVGNMGSSQRLNYTVMGDTVNLASRLETASKDLKSSVVISESTFRAAEKKIDATFLNEIYVKGKEEKIRVYGLQGLK